MSTPTIQMRQTGLLHFTRSTGPFLAVSFLVGFPACQWGTAQELDDLRTENAQLKKDKSKLEETLALSQSTERKLRQSLLERSAQVVACRMQLPSDDTALFANLSTSMGEIRIRLDWKSAPYTVQNFVGLAEGTRAFRDYTTGELVRRPFYDGVVFHRVVPDFMIQTGDQKGDGTGNPGFTIPDELTTDAHFDKAGWVGMANTGTDSNGAQFFILDGAAPNLDGKHTRFGEVVSGIEVVHAIARVERDKQDRPLAPVVLKSVRIERVSSSEPPR